MPKVGDDFPSKLTKEADVPRLIGSDKVITVDGEMIVGVNGNRGVMEDERGGLFGETWRNVFTGNKIKICVDLTRVGGNKIGRQEFGQMEGESGFAGGGGSGDDKEGVVTINRGGGVHGGVVC